MFINLLCYYAVMNTTTTEQTALKELKEQFKASIEYINTILKTDDLEEAKQNTEYIIHDWSNMNYQNSEVLSWLKTINELRLRLSL